MAATFYKVGMHHVAEFKMHINFGPLWGLNGAYFICCSLDAAGKVQP
jgi:hypothetical protein